MNLRPISVFAVTLAVLSAAAPAAHAQFSPLHVQVPEPPNVLVAENAAHLVYEVYVTNLSGLQVTLSAVEVRDGRAAADASPRLRLEREALTQALQRVGDPTATDPQVLPPGESSIGFVWVTVPLGDAPRSLAHRWVLRAALPDGQVVAEAQTFEGVVIPVGTQPPPSLGAPLRGDHWFAGNAPSNVSPHRRAVLSFTGQARIAQRFAIDWIRFYDDGRTYRGDPTQNSSYRAYGEPVLAVKSGRVVETVDGIPENTPGAPEAAVPITPETVGGNYVLLDVGGGKFAFYGHLQPGSLAVRRGDEVRRGAVLGLLGNSGNSTEPHLHFHVSDRSSGLDAEGVPYAFDSFVLEIGGEAITPLLLPDGHTLRMSDEGLAAWRAARRQRISRELPLQNAIVTFGHN